MLYVICYDIGNDRSRNRAAKLLEGIGRRVQKSIFECELTPKRLQSVMKRLNKLMGEEDRCCAYAICLECYSKKVAIGKPIEPEWGSSIIL